MSEPTRATPKATTANAADRREFIATLLDVDRGRVHDDATNLMAEAVMAVEKTMKPATVTVTLKIEPQDPKTFQDTGVLFIEGEAKATLPRVKRAASLFYATGIDGQVTRDDPHGSDPRDRD